jgi:NADH:ubiquinone oxidoreductase subunit E
VEKTRDSDIDLALLTPVIEQKKKVKGSLIAILQAAQELYGYLPESALQYIHEKTGLPLSHIYGVVTFYAQFHVTPRGRHIVRACRGTACHVRGAQKVINALKADLDIEENQTTPDMNFTFETVACFGACALAPVIMVDKKYFGAVDARRVEMVLKQYQYKQRDLFATNK